VSTKPRAKDDYGLPGVKRKIREVLERHPEGLSIDQLMIEVGASNRNSFSVQLSHTRARLKPFGLTISRAHGAPLKLEKCDA